LASIIDQMTELYVFIDDFSKAHPQLARWRSSPYSQPAFTDAEVLTVALMQNCLGVATFEQTYKLIAENYRSAFPHLCSYPQWLNRLHRLGEMIGRLFAALRYCSNLQLYLIDSKPIPVCKPRDLRSQLGQKLTVQKSL
jgi:hypothetical protein